VALPSGFGLASGGCSDADSSVNAGARTATINLQAGETVVCTFSSANSRQKTVAAIHRFLSERNDRILSHEPSGQRQIDRLIEAGRWGGGAPASTGFSTPSDVPGIALLGPSFRTRGEVGSVAGVAAPSPDGFDRSARVGLPFTISGDTEESTQFSFATSLRQMERTGADLAQSNRLGMTRYTGGYAPQAFDIWVEGSHSSFSDSKRNLGESGHFGIVYAGADYVVSPSLLIGALVQFDDMTHKIPGATMRVSGEGWMAGPYATVRLSDNLFLQARIAWGESSNEISPYGTYTDEFDTWRWLARGSLVGRWDYGPWQFRPRASVAYIEENQKAYTDSLGVLIPGQKVSLGQAKFGPEVGYRWRLPNGTLVEPSFSLEGIWNFSQGQTPFVLDPLGATDDFRGKLELAVKWLDISGVEVGVAASYDGIGSETFHAWGAKARVRVPLQ